MTVNEQVLEGNWNEIKGELRQRWGQLSDDQLELAHGSVEQLVGTIQRQTGETREAVERYLEELTDRSASSVAHAAEVVRNYTHATQETLHNAAEQTSEAFNAGYRKAEQTVQKRPVESLAACFGAGLITGVVVSLMMRSR